MIRNYAPACISNSESTIYKTAIEPANLVQKTQNSIQMSSSSDDDQVNTSDEAIDLINQFLLSVRDNQNNVSISE